MESTMDVSDYYKSYENLEIHQLMLRDGPRNRAYKQAIHDNKNQLRGKTVLDVGAGTGILSVFCAQAGAARVFAVEASGVYRIAENVVKENRCEDVVQVIHARVEDVELPEMVDVIVSEWMGFYLLHEAMLDSVIVARDKFLKIGGLIFPETATLFSAPCSLPALYDFWTDVDGVSMEAFGAEVRRVEAKRPVPMEVQPSHILAEAEVVAWFDLREVTLDDLATLKTRHVAVADKVGKYQGICLWFSCMFPSTTAEPVTLTTEPGALSTHWRQTVIVLPIEIEADVQTPIAYELEMRRTDQRRRYNIEITMLDPDNVEHPEYCTCHKTKCILTRAVLENYEKQQKHDQQT